MRRVNLIELCTYFSNVYKETTNTYYSNEPSDWLDDLRNYENNATYLGTTNNGQVENYKVNDVSFIKETGKCFRISFNIDYITTASGQVVSNFYLSDYDFRKYVKNNV